MTPPPNPPLPPELEADLLAWVEAGAADSFGGVGSQSLPADAQARIAAAFREDPALARHAHALRADRARLRAWPVPPMPAGMLDAVELALEREALLGLASTEARAAGAIPVSRIQPIRTSVFRRPMARALAVAAGLALVSGSLWLTLPRGGTPGTLARSSASPATETRETALASAARSTEADAASAPTLTTPPPDHTAALAGMSPTTTLAAAKADAQSAQPEPPALAGVAPERAEQLFREGRLAVRVWGADRATIEPAATGAWRWADAARSTGVVDRTLAMLPAPSDHPALAGRAPLALARARAAAAEGGQPASLPGSSERAAPSVPVPPEPAVLLAALRADSPRSVPALLDRLRAALQATDRPAVIELIELPATPAASRGQDPALLLWWTLPPEAWSPPALVPVIIER
jgi:hypothetical protein